MKAGKAIFLSLALVLPVLVFLFLKFFGKNEFVVPALFQEGVIESPGSCAGPYNTPYLLTDSIRLQYGLLAQPFTVIYFADTLENSLMKQVEEMFSKDSVRFTHITSENSFLVNENDGLDGTMRTAGEFKREKECVFLLPEPLDVVLVNALGTIYGQYDSHDLDEMDRLKAEILIVLKKY